MHGGESRLERQFTEVFFGEQKFRAVPHEITSYIGGHSTEPDLPAIGLPVGTGASQSVWAGDRGLGLQFPAGNPNFSSLHSVHTWGPIQPPIQWVPGVKRADRETDCSHLMPRWRICGGIPLLPPYFSVWSLIRPRSNFTFTKQGSEVKRLSAMFFPDVKNLVPHIRVDIWKFLVTFYPKSDNILAYPSAEDPSWLSTPRNPVSGPQRFGPTHCPLIQSWGWRQYCRM
jgi:hypothetical protein